MPVPINDQWQATYDPSSEARRVLLVDADGSVQGSLITIIDEASATTTYIGEAKPGTATSSSSWRIKRLSTAGSVTTISWADGVTTFTKKWDDRTTYNYV